MTDVVFCSVPYVDTVEPCMAPGVLKSVAEAAGFSAAGLDLNIEIVNKIKQSPNQDHLIDFFLEDYYINDKNIDEILEYIYFVADKILEKNPKIIALSLLTYASKIFTYWLCLHLKSVAPEKVIVIGGPGIRSFLVDSKDQWAHNLQNLGLIDDFIVGDGEVSVVEYLKGNKKYPGINSSNWQQLENLNIFPHPNFGDYNFSHYEKPSIPVLESRGCVRTCEFCDIIEHWTKFQGRTAEGVFAEIVHQAQKYNVRRISMRNALTNGNMKVFKQLLKLMADYNRSHPPEEQLSWIGYFIVRPSSAHSEELWQDLRDSNAMLLLGVESVIERVRHQMGKKFSNEDIDYHLEMGRKYRVPLKLLVISGYPTESRADFEFTKQWYIDRKQYAGNSVYAVSYTLASILPGTELERKKDDYGIETSKYPSVWFNQQYNISAKEKLQMYNEINQLLHKIGFGGTNIATTQAKAAINVIDDFA